MKIIFILFLATFVVFNVSGQSTAKGWYDKGTELKKSDKFKEAVDAFKKAVSLQPTYADALYELGWCYNELGMYNEAIDAFRKEEKNKPSSLAKTYFEIGYAYKGLLKYEDAIIYFTKTINLDSEYELAYKDRGYCYYKAANYEKALPDYNEYADLVFDDIDDADFWYQKGWLENDLAKYNDAIKSLKNSISIDKKYPDAYSELGYSYFKLDRNSDAISNYRMAIGLDSKYYSPLAGMGDVYYDNLKNYDSALYYYEKAIQIKQTGKSVYYRLGWCYNDKKRYSDAIEPLKKAIAIDNSYNLAKTELGYSYYKLEQYDNALSQFRPVISEDEKSELSRYYAGFCYYLKNDQNNLKKMIEELKKINTDNSWKYVETLSKYIK